MDTSWLAAIAFGQPGHEHLAETLGAFEQRFAAGLLEAELWSACHREGVEPSTSLVDGLAWVRPGRSLRPEIEQVLAAGDVRGADLWHLACALYLTPDPGELAFLTADQRQADVAAALGLQIHETHRRDAAPTSTDPGIDRPEAPA
ncbi:MAG: PIN domain-containing protein [Chloroflexi bacterium]|nr:PIN domain-containing protein [Chloroflexota bacterium]